MKRWWCVTGGECVGNILGAGWFGKPLKTLFFGGDIRYGKL
ncbi:hypothetical protein [Bartonella grahamii]|nr:hypothetical protein [Bartonella grahamii]